MWFPAEIRKISFSHDLFLNSFCNFVENMAVSCFVQNFESIGQLKRILWTSRNLDTLIDDCRIWILQLIYFSYQRITREAVFVLHSKISMT